MSGFRIKIDDPGNIQARACYTRTFDACEGEPRRVARYGSILQPEHVESSVKTRPTCPLDTLRVLEEREPRDPKSDNKTLVPSVTCGIEYRPGRVCPDPPPPSESQSKSDIPWCDFAVDCGSLPAPPPPKPRCYTDAELRGSGWGYCPPCVDYRKLIIPLDSSSPSSKRPTGHPYFNHGAKACEETVIPVACKKGVFRFCDWMATVKDREPPPSLQCQCLPSTCCWCQPSYENCCPRFCDPAAYTLTRAT